MERTRYYATRSTFVTNVLIHVILIINTKSEHQENSFNLTGLESASMSYQSGALSTEPPS